MNGDVDLIEGGQPRASQAAADYVRPTWDSIGSLVIERHFFDNDQRLGVHSTGRRARGRGVASAQAGRVAPRGIVVTASVPCSRFPNELPNVSNPAEVPQFVGVQDGADRLHPTVRYVEREDVD